MALRRYPLLWSLTFGLMLFGGAPNPAAAEESGFKYKVARSKDGGTHHGVLTIDGSGVGYSEPEDQSDNFRLSCGDFVKGMSFKESKKGSFLQVPVRWRDRSLRSDDEELTTENLFELVEAVCKTPGVATTPANVNEVIYRVAHPASSISGALTVSHAQVSFNPDVRQPNVLGVPFILWCHDFLIQTTLKGASLEVERAIYTSAGYLPSELIPEEKGLSAAILYQGIRDVCAIQRVHEAEVLQAQQSELRRLADVARTGGEVSYDVVAGSGSGSFIRRWRRLTVRHAMVVLGNSQDGASDNEMTCREFLDGAKETSRPASPLGSRRTIIDAQQGQLHISRVTTDDYVSVMLRQIKVACGAQQGQADAQRAADFHVGILAALRAAEDPDPFSSIRGDFDLSASDSRQWKASLQLAGADKCALLKTPPPTPASAPVWTFGCLFPASGNSYEAMVKSVQSILNLSYEPDEKAANMNQVFFADRSKPARRVFVSKINEATIGVSVVAVQSVGAPADFNSASFLGAPTSLPTAPTISAEIEAVKNSAHGNFPHIQSTGAPATSNGMAVFEVKNNTPYTLTALFSGPIERRVEVAPRGSISIDLQPGSYKLVGRVNAPDVLPSYGEHVFDASSAGVAFYIQ